MSSKKRGLYTDSKLSLDGIAAAVITQRLLLRVVGQCYDLSGRHICPVFMAGRLMYGSICKLKLGWDGACVDQIVEANSRKFLCDILDVCNNLKPVERAWIPIGFELEQIICPIDGGEQGFAAHGYVRSQAVGAADSDSDSFCSRLAVARCKVSNRAGQSSSRNSCGGAHVRSNSGAA